MSERLLVVYSTIADFLIVHSCLKKAGRGKDIELVIGSVGNEADNIRACAPGAEIIDAGIGCFDPGNLNLVNLLSAPDLCRRISCTVPTGFDTIKYLSYHKKSLLHLSVIPLPEHPLILELDNKVAFHAFCMEKDLPHPLSLRLREDEVDPPRGLSFPLLVKLPFSSAGKGNIFCADLKALHEARKRHPGDLLLQEIVPGHDLAFNAYCIDGEVRTWTVQMFLTPDGGNLRWSQFVEHEAACDIGRRVVALSNYTGPINIDLRVREGDGKIFLIEVNPRFWANTHHSLVDGVNFVEAGIRLRSEPGFLKQPALSNKVWGTPQRLPGLLLKKRLSLGQTARYVALQSPYQLESVAGRLAYRLRLGALRQWRRLGRVTGTGLVPVLKKLMGKLAAVEVMGTYRADFDHREALPIAARLQIRPAGETDISSVMACSDRNIAKRIGANQKCFVAIVGNEMAGYLWVSEDGFYPPESIYRIEVPQGAVYLYDLYTMERFRGNSLSKHLMSFVLDHYRRPAFSIINKDNAPSITQASRNGFRLVSEQRYLKLSGRRFRLSPDAGASGEGR